MKSDENYQNHVVNERYLNPEAIFTLNKELDIMIDMMKTLAPGGIDVPEYGTDYWVTPALFRKKSRSWHMACVLNAWHVQEGDLSLSGNKFIVEALHLLINICEGYFSEQDNSESALLVLKEHYSEILDSREGAENHYKSFVAYETNLTESKEYKKSYEQIKGYLDRLFRHFSRNGGKLNFANSLDKTEHLAGVLNLKKSGKLDSEACQHLIHALLMLYHGCKMHRCLLLPGLLYREAYKYNKKGIAWLECLAIDSEAKEHETLFYTGLSGKPDKANKKKNSQFSCNNVHIPEVKANFETVGKERGAYLLQELCNIFYLYRMNEALNEKQGNKRLSVLTLPLLVLPLYDTWIGSVGCGGIWGCLIFSFCDNDLLDRFKRGQLTHIKSRSQALANRLTRAAMTRISNREISPPYDLIELFLSCLISIQDWEWISVIEDGTPLYCYHRQSDQEKYDADCLWERCSRGCDKPCYLRYQKKPRVMKWRDYGFNPWNRNLMPELLDEEINTYGNLTFEFVYSETTWIPENIKGAETLKLFELTLIEQQLEMLRVLVSKVQGRRNALQNAVVSVMGRNMSHNIGSHVLARYVDQDRDETDMKQAKHLMRYLQNRMDYIADISTTDVFYNLPVRFYQDTICELIGKKDQHGVEFRMGQDILLNNISGLKDIKLRVIPMNEPTEDFSYDSPGGHLGMQAVYVILENIARNTAKHDVSGNGDISVQHKEISENSIRLSFSLHKAVSELYFMICPDEHKMTPEIIKQAAINGRNCEVLPFQELVEDGRTSLDGGEHGWPSGKNEIILEFDPGSDIEAFKKTQISTKRDISLYIRVENVDNLDTQGFYKVLVWDDRSDCWLSEKSWLPTIINNKLKHPMINSAGKIESADWGIREIFLAASYIREIRLSDLESREIWPGTCSGCSLPVIEAVAVDREGREINEQPDARQDSHHLGYKFYLKKNKILLEVAEEGGNWASHNEESGIRVEQGESAEAKSLLEALDPYNAGLFYSHIILPEKIYLELTDAQRIQLPLMCHIREEIQAEFSKDKVEAQLANEWWREHLSSRIGMREDMIDLTRTGADDNKQGLLCYQPVDDIIQSLDSEDGKSVLLFDDHGFFYNRLKKAHKTDLMNKLAFYEPFRKRNPQYDLIYANKLDGIDLELKTAALTDVIIIDERVQAVLHHNAGFGEMTFGQLFQWMGIHVPAAADVNLDDIKLERDKLFSWLEEIKDKLRAKGRRTVCNDFILIHQTIIDKLRDVSASFDNELLKAARRLGCEERIVVCSGRGNPRGNLPHYARFIPISGILQWTSSSPSKYHLVRLLCHARQPSMENRRQSS